MSDSGDQYCRMCGMYLTQRSGKKSNRKNGIMRGQGLQVSYLRTVLLVILLTWIGLAALYVFFGSQMLAGFQSAVMRLLQRVVKLLMLIQPNLRDHYMTSVMAKLDASGYAAAAGRTGQMAFLAACILRVIPALLLFFAMWRMFRKADMHGWFILIPVWNVICLFRLVLGSGWTVLIPIGISLVGGFLGMIGGGILTLLASIGMLIFWVIFFSHWAARFGHGIGYTLGLIFLNPLFVLILGWGKDRYYID